MTAPIKGSNLRTAIEGVVYWQMNHVIDPDKLVDRIMKVIETHRDESNVFTPALILDYGRVQAERDRLKAELDRYRSQPG